MGGADLCSTQTYRFAHIHAITGMDASPNDASIYATCSLDKTALLWDERLTRPATGECIFKSCRQKVCSH